MINLTDVIIKKLGIAKEDFLVGEYTVPLIALTDDLRELVETAEDSYPSAIVYGLRDGLEPLIKANDFNYDDVLSIVESQGFTDDDMKAIAEQVLNLSDMAELIEDDEVIIDGDNITDEQLDVSIGSYQP